MKKFHFTLGFLLLLLTINVTTKASEYVTYNNTEPSFQLINRVVNLSETNEIALEETNEDEIAKPSHCLRTNTFGTSYCYYFGKKGKEFQLKKSRYHIIFCSDTSPPPHTL